MKCAQSVHLHTEVLRKEWRREVIRLRNTHHRKPRSIGGKSNKKNCIKVPQNQHEAYHLLFRNYTPDIVAEILNKYWIDQDFTLVVLQKDLSKVPILQEIE